MAKDDAFVIRTDRSGRVVAMSHRAQVVVGNELLGRACELVVRAVSPDGESVCRPGCAAALATGEVPCSAARDAVVRGQRVQLRCLRVGDEAIVVADPVQSAGPTEKLTPREREVLALVAQGLSSSQIAGALGVSTATVRTHVEHALGRLGAKTRAEAVLRATNTGQLPRAS